MELDAHGTESLFVKLRRFAARQYWAWSIAGSLVLGLTLPVLLVMWNMRWSMNAMAHGPGPKPDSEMVLHVLAETAVLLWLALIFCGPLAVIFALCVHWHLRMRAQRDDATIDGLAKRGAVLAGGVAFLNLPGYLAGALLPETGVPVLIRLPLLFVVAGVSCGLWIAWQAWRASRPDEPLLPRYSLAWLLGGVLAWATVMAVFAPK